MNQQEILIKKTLWSKSCATIRGSVAQSRTKRKSAGEREVWRPAFNLDTLREIVRSRFGGLVRHYRALWCTFTLFITNDRAPFSRKSHLSARQDVIIQWTCLTYCLTKLKSNSFSTGKYFQFILKSVFAAAIERFQVAKFYVGRPDNL